MTYDFTSRTRGLGRVVFALTLDRKRMTERIVIGRIDEARLRFEYGTGGVFYDETRPLGSLLLRFEADTEWSRIGAVLRESYEKTFRESSRWKMTSPISETLRAKYESGEPSAMFAAIKTWEDYLNCFNLNHGAELLTDRLSMLYKPFRVFSESCPWQSEASAALTDVSHDGESGVELWYPVAKRPFEVVVIATSFLSVIFYYLHKIEEWRFVFQRCKICGNDFLTKSRHFELCSDECRKKQAVTAKREFDERMKGDRLEQLDEAAYYYWYNRLRKLRKAAEQDAAASFKAAFDMFRKEAVKRKAAVRRGEAKPSDFSAWLAEKQDEADRLMEGIAAPRNL